MEFATQTLIEFFEAQAARCPDAVAVVCGEDEISYKELNARANRLARHLIDHGIGPEDLVGIILDRSIEMIICVLGTLKSGGAYLPMDPAHPDKRLSLMVSDAQPRLLIVESDTSARLEESGVKALNLDHQEFIDGQSQHPDHDVTDGERAGQVHPESAAYVIFTSGSTGRPKGVITTHQGVSKMLLGIMNLFDFHEADRWTFFHSLSFDFSVWEIFGCLCSGGTLHIISHSLARSPELFRQYVVANDVTILSQTPSSAYQVFPRHSGPALSIGKLRAIIFGGEALDSSKIAELPNVALLNMYGITEVTVHATFTRVQNDGPEQGKTPIGSALPGTHVHVLDEHLNAAAPGTVGEIYISGPGLARGYLGRPGLTGNRFVACPFESDGARMYRTGDLAFWRPDGMLDFVGRSDQQVKIRGHRIEPAEVETALSSLQGVSQSTVIARRDKHGDQRLIGYVVPTDAANPPDSIALRRRLEERLPDYMVPAAIMTIDTLPLTINGKLDQGALPTSEIISRSKVMPATTNEQLLADIFADVLGVEKVGVDDNFFDLGGHSLMATRVVAKVKRLTQKAVNVRTIFEHPTVGQLNAKLEQLPQSKQPVLKRSS
jgi:nonribosomal peptide synthetase DhbF